MITSHGYVMTKAPGWWRWKTYRDGYVYEHRVVIAKKTGRPPGRKQVVHHKNGDRKDNRPSNLAVMDRSDHCGFHNSQRGKCYVFA